MRILLAEDDRDLSYFIQEGLIQAGFAVELAHNGKEAYELAIQYKYDLILLDIMMPEMNGHEVLQRLRRQGNKAAIIMLTCKGHENDKLLGFNGGADDYLVKPFLLSELVARIRAIIRRTITSTQSDRSSLLKCGDLQMDLLKREVRRRGKMIKLTKKEFDLLECLMRQAGQVISQAILAQHLSQIDFGTQTNAIEVHVKNLRSKIDPHFSRSLIRTVRGCGYALNI